MYKQRLLYQLICQAKIIAEEYCLKVYIKYFSKEENIIEIKGKETKGWVAIDQIRTVDKRRITKIFGKISENEILKIKEVLKETFVD